MLILNRPGAGGLIGLQAAAAAKPDGYTLYMPLSSTFVVLPVTHPKLPIDLARDVVPVGLIGEQPMVIAANAKISINSLTELIARAKQRPDAISYGANVGGLPHLTAEIFQQRAGIKLSHIPYPNTAKATQDAAAGVVQLAIESLSGLAGSIQSGMLKPRRRIDPPCAGLSRSVDGRRSSSGVGRFRSAGVVCIDDAGRNTGRNREQDQRRSSRDFRRSPTCRNTLPHSAPMRVRCRPPKPPYTSEASRRAGNLS